MNHNQENFQENLPYPDNLVTLTAKPGARIFASFIDLLSRVVISIPLGIILTPPTRVYLNYLFDQIQRGQIVFFDASYLDKYLVLILIYNVIASLILQFIIPLLSKGKTIGKLFLGLRIIEDNGEYASPSKLFLRSTIYVAAPLVGYLPLLGDIASFVVVIVWIISFILLFSDHKHQTVHDKYSGCLVVYDNEYQNKYGR